MRILFT